MMTNAAMAGDELTLRQNIVGSLASGPVDVAEINALVASVNADGTFSNIDYARNEAANWGPINHINQLHTLAVAYANPGRQVHGDAKKRRCAMRRFVPTTTGWTRITPQR